MGLIYYPHLTLLTTAQPVTEFDDDLQKTVDSMKKIMEECNGLGLAANQVRVLKRVILTKIGDHIEPFINPVITAEFEKTSIHETCLSLPGISVRLPRAKFIEFTYQDITGKAQEMSAEDLLAVVVQHEIDHLNGLTLLQKVSPIERPRLAKKVKMAVRRIKRLK